MDILDAIATTRRAFKSANLEAPTAIFLGSHEEGMRFLSAVRQESQWIAVCGDPSLGHAVELADGSVCMEIKVMDVAIRWPANRYANSDGSWRYA
jgi:hypothetical protein